MKRIILALAIGAAAVAQAASPAATQEWVRNYIATNGAASMTSSVYSNATLSTTAVDGRYSVQISIEDATVYALRATNVSASAVATGVTNGYTFVWRGATATNGIYKTGGIEILATKTNFVWNGIGSVYTNSASWFGNYFSVFGVKLQPSVAAQYPED